MRLRFYLRHDADPESRQDSIAITLEGGAARYLIGADHLESIRLTQKEGRFEIALDGVFQVLVLDGCKTIWEEKRKGKKRKEKKKKKRWADENHCL